MTKSPSVLFFEWLTDRPAAARLVVAIDSDRLLTNAGLFSKDRLLDLAGRDWLLIIFRNDEIGFRNITKRLQVLTPIHAFSELVSHRILQFGLTADEMVVGNSAFLSRDRQGNFCGFAA